MKQRNNLEQDYTQLCESLSYHFKRIEHLVTALTHASVGCSNNERLEFLGDALLGLVIAESLFIRFPSANEGQLTRLRATLVNKKTLMKVAQVIDLWRYLQLGKGERNNKGQTRASVLSDAVEAVIAAIYLDGGINPCRQTILKLWQTHLESLSLKTVIKDPKTRLQEYLQAKKLPLPEYRILDVQGEPHAQTFEIECIIQNIPPAQASGSSRRYAEQAAAEKVLNFLNDKE